MLVLWFSVAWLTACSQKKDKLETSLVDSSEINIYSFMDLEFSYQN
jgi:hypothetical protein